MLEFRVCFSHPGRSCSSMRHNHMDTDWFCLTIFLCPDWSDFYKLKTHKWNFSYVNHSPHFQRKPVSYFKAQLTYKQSRRISDYFKSERRICPVQWAMSYNSHNRGLQIRRHCNPSKHVSRREHCQQSNFYNTKLLQAIVWRPSI